jgi:hypothetical protein
MAEELAVGGIASWVEKAGGRAAVGGARGGGRRAGWRRRGLGKGGEEADWAGARSVVLSLPCAGDLFHWPTPH